jgi:tRNA A-37 threonylcarbamoyl transferase component Bud32
MGEVYKARDTRLDRLVAIKTSKEQFTERFEREARAVAALNHPNICTLHDVGPNYLVMEYIEGPPLKGPLPLDQALAFAGQICDALHTAHRQGIVHRDLKPANILVTKSGIKLLDFGLAKRTRAESAEAATVTIALTKEHSILGTLQYMSPEQLEGKDADHRSDIFALGAVLYEMLTGRRAFEGQSQASIVAAILEREPPPLVSAGAAVPASLERVVTKCMAKDPDGRCQSARDLGDALQWAGPAAPEQAIPRPRWPWIWMAAGAVLLLATVAGWLRGPFVRPPLRLEIVPPSGVELAPNGTAISPDGRLFAFVGIREGKRQLWLRSMDSGATRPLPGTDDASLPFWSPDSRSIGFFGLGKLRRADLNGTVRVICDAVLGEGGSWSAQGTIVCNRATSSTISRVSAAGGSPVFVTAFDRARLETGHFSPYFLPDGRHFLYLALSANPQNSGIYMAGIGPGLRGSPCL